MDYANKPGEIGFSALDLGRLLVWLKIVKERYPQHADAVDRFVLRWKWGHVVDRSGMMFGAILDKDRNAAVRAGGSPGYEEYAAKGFQLWGIATELASRPEPYATVPIYCVEVPYDARDPRKYYQHNYVVTESYVLDGVEFNWDTTLDRDTDDRKHSNAWMLDFANRVYQAQENRWRATGILTARSEHQLDAEPYFVYDTVFTDGYAWNTITEPGQYVPQYAAVSLKAALGMWALWASPYTDRLFEEVARHARSAARLHGGGARERQGADPRLHRQQQRDHAGDACCSRRRASCSNGAAPPRAVGPHLRGRALRRTGPHGRHAGALHAGGGERARGAGLAEAAFAAGERGAAALAGCGVVSGNAPRAGDGPGCRSGTQEFQWARTAWRYLENNTDDVTGLVNGMDRVPTFTAWNAGDAIAATIAGHELGVIDAREFDLRLSRLLGFLATMDLSQGQLPNKVYNAVTGKMVGFENRPDDIGWSAVDIGRLLLWLRIAGQRHPKFQEYADKVVVRWTFCNVHRRLRPAAGHGAQQRAGDPLSRRPPRLRAARGRRLCGVGLRCPPVYRVAGRGVGEHLRHALEGRRSRSAHARGAGPGAHHALSSSAASSSVGPLPMAAPRCATWRSRCSACRRNAGVASGQVTARTDYQLREAPYVVLDSVYASGYAWNTVGNDGKEYERLAQVSTRAAFGLAALWPGDYAEALIDNVRFLFDPDRGWFEGRFEQGGGPNTNITLSTNAAILETLLFKAKGTLYAHGASRARVLPGADRRCLQPRRPLLAGRARGVRLLIRVRFSA